MRMHIYKPGQGKYTRLCSGFSVAIIVAMGCWRLYEKLEASDLNLWVVTMVPVGVFVAFAVAIFWLLNKASLANFLIAAEGELKKVNWSSRKEVAASTVIVIIVVIGMAVLLGTTDLVFQLIFRRLLG
ncbi:MAG: preprotein translocase subunit SecE [Sedimentisphaerales bacterium]|nr:preprotein translocase subunit SecE [Sedimentisphaerales bacterium]